MQLPQTDQSSPAPPSPATVSAVPANQTLVWALATLPITGAALSGLALLAGISGTLVGVVIVAAAALLVMVDKRRLVAAGAASRAALPATAWFLFVPVYLWKRATLLSSSRAPAWASLIGAGAAPVVLMLVAGLTAAASGLGAASLPDCAARAVASDVIRIFGDIPEVRRLAVRGVHLSKQTEFAQGPGRQPRERYCSATVLASDTREYEVEYSLELRGADLIVHVELP